MERVAVTVRLWGVAFFVVAFVALFGISPSAWADDVAHDQSGSSVFAAARNGGLLLTQGANADIEPNDTREQARVVSLGMTYGGGNSSDDDKYDWYKLTLPSSGLLSVDASLTDCSIDLYSASGKFLSGSGATWDDFSCRLASGVYYLRLSGWYAESALRDDSRYTFKATLESAYESFKETQGGSNNSIARASRIALGTSYRGQIAQNDDVDYYRFVLPASGRITLTSAVFFNAGLQLLDASGSTLWDDTLRLDSSSTRANGSWILDLGRGDYYLRVAGNDSIWPQNHEGIFTFKVAFANAGESFAENQGGSNNFFGSTSAIGLGKTYVSQLALNDSRDIFQFKTSNSGVVRIRANSGLSSTIYRIADLYGDMLATSSDSWNETTKRQNFSWTYSCGKGTHYLVIEKDSYSYADQATGPIAFSVKELKSIGKAKVGKIKSVAYTGKPVKPSGITVKLGGKVLKLNRDYTVKFSKNKKVGTAKVTITGIGDYTGTKTATFKIKKAKQKLKVKGGFRYVNSRYTLDYWESVRLGKADVCTIKKSAGKVTFKKVRANKRSGCFTVKKNGTVIVKAGTPEGAYKLKIKAKAKGNRNYKPGKTTFTVKIKVTYW